MYVFPEISDDLILVISSFGTYRIGSLRILCVTIASDLSVSAHVEALLNAGARSIYPPPSAERARVTRPIAKDRYKGNNHQPHPICGSCIVGYANAADNGRIQRLIDRMYKSGFLTEQDTDIE